MRPFHGVKEVCTPGRSRRHGRLTFFPNTESLPDRVFCLTLQAPLEHGTDPVPERDANLPPTKEGDTDTGNPRVPLVGSGHCGTTGSMPDQDMDSTHHSQSGENAKDRGAYYTPDPVVQSLVRWVVSRQEDRLLDPTCGDGCFIERHVRSVGVEQDPKASASAMARAPTQYYRKQRKAIIPAEVTNPWNFQSFI